MPSKLQGRYDTRGKAEGECEAGSQGRVLKNLLGMKRAREMNVREWETLNEAFLKAIHLYQAGHSFTARDIRALHKMWLGKICSWAGRYRQVNISKGNFPFAAANQVEKLMARFEKKQLKKYTPCNFSQPEQITKAITIVHWNQY